MLPDGGGIVNTQDGVIENLSAKVLGLHPAHQDSCFEFFNPGMRRALGTIVPFGTNIKLPTQLTQLDTRVSTWRFPQHGGGTKSRAMNGEMACTIHQNMGQWGQIMSDSLLIPDVPVFA